MGFHPTWNFHDEKQCSPYEHAASRMTFSSGVRCVHSRMHYWAAAKRFYLRESRVEFPRLERFPRTTRNATPPTSYIFIASGILSLSLNEIEGNFMHRGLKLPHGFSQNPPTLNQHSPYMCTFEAISMRVLYNMYVRMFADVYDFFCESIIPIYYRMSEYSWWLWE